MGNHLWQALYWAVLAGMCLYGFHRYVILFLYWRNAHRKPDPTSRSEFVPLPHVTVQLPVFNEFFVVERLLESVAGLDYPKDRLQIQVLDDSTDETRERTREKVDALRARGFDAEWIYRTDRTGFKAGALANGLASCKGEFVLVLDADFVAPPDLLRRTIPYFVDPRVGMVQTRWGHLNRDYSLLTRVQALFIDAHFALEQVARSRSGRFFNFNGTGGIWRKACIEDAGGWQHDTLTEDLDLSYRAQIKGWRFVYDNDVVVPGELPVEMNGFKSQQHRWAKGSMQTCIKMLPRVWASRLPLLVKIEAAAHLTAYFICVLLVLFCVLIQPALVPVTTREAWQLWLIDVPVFLLSSIPFLLYYLVAQRQLNPHGWKKDLLLAPFMVALGAGVSLNNARAVLEAVIGFQSGFIRTPKYGIEKKGQPWRRGRYSPLRSMLIAIELLFGLYFGVLVVHAILTGCYTAVPFLLLFCLGFGYVAFQSVAHAFPKLFWPKPADEEVVPA